MDTGACRKGQWFARTEKVSMAESFIFIYDFATKNRIYYDSFTFKTLSNLKLLSQLTQAKTVKFNHQIFLRD